MYGEKASTKHSHKFKTRSYVIYTIVDNHNFESKGTLSIDNLHNYLVQGRYWEQTGENHFLLTCTSFFLNSYD
jgi:hypothetical protein